MTTIPRAISCAEIIAGERSCAQFPKLSLWPDWIAALDAIAKGTALADGRENASYCNHCAASKESSTPLDSCTNHPEACGCGRGWRACAANKRADQIRRCDSQA